MTESVGHPPGSDLFPAMFLDNRDIRYHTLYRKVSIIKPVAHVSNAASLSLSRYLLYPVVTQNGNQKEGGHVNQDRRTHCDASASSG